MTENASKKSEVKLEEISNTAKVVAQPSPHHDEHEMHKHDGTYSDIQEAGSTLTENAIYIISFSVGKPNGLRLQKSFCGDTAVVTGVNRELFMESIRDYTPLRTSGDVRWGCSNQQYQRNEMKLPSNIFVRNVSSTDQPGQECLEIEAIEEAGGVELVHIPLPGAIILAINAVSSTSLGFDGMCQHIYQMTGSHNAAQPDMSGKQKRSMAEVPSVLHRDKLRTSYTITFREARSEHWSYVDKVDVKITNFKLTVINDINGRDMPILRASLKGTNVHMERGLGLKTNSIQAPTPSILKFCGKDVNEGAIYSSPFSDLSEAIMKFNAEGETCIEYYNARVALWEPMLEPQLLQILCECQQGNSKLKRPGSLAIALSDGRLDLFCWEPKECFIDSDSSFVSINITDAASEVLVKTMLEWNEWRKLSALAKVDNLDQLLSENNGSDESGASPQLSEAQQITLTGLDKNEITNGRIQIQLDSGENNSRQTKDPVSDLLVTSNIHSRLLTTVKYDAAQNAAQAALIFAKKRGASTQQKSDYAKPFILKNRSGLPIYFEQQSNNTQGHWHQSTYIQAVSTNKGERNEVAKKLPFASMRVGDGCEARFNLETVKEEYFVSNHRGISSDSGDQPTINKRVKREYEGRFPHLTVALDPSASGVTIEPIYDLPVVKVGETIRRLQVQILGNTGEAVRMSSVVVVWTVELENQRRILTLRSATSISSLCCGIPIEIGVHQKLSSQSQGSNEQEDGIDSEVLLGVSLPGSPLYLPLWLDLSFKDISLVVRPAALDSSGLHSSTDKHNLYQWSSRSILEYGRHDADTNENGFNESSPVSDINMSKGEVWKWKETKICSKVCNFPELGGSSFGLLPVWLSFLCVRGNTDESDVMADIKRPNNLKATKKRAGVSWSLLNVTIGTSLSVHNMLPVSIEWEVAETLHDELTKSSSISLLDGSSMRSRQLQNIGFIPFAAEIPEISPIGNSMLKSGAEVDVFSCNVSSMSVQGRVRCDRTNGEWSEWAHISGEGRKEYTIFTLDALNFR